MIITDSPFSSSKFTEVGKIRHRLQEISVQLLMLLDISIVLACLNVSLDNSIASLLIIEYAWRCACKITLIDALHRENRVFKAV